LVASTVEEGNGVDDDDDDVEDDEGGAEDVPLPNAKVHAQ
jgi:hypothetical protein